MIQNVYSIRDRKSFYGSVFCDFNDDTAKRGFSMSLASGDSVVGFSAHDFDLICVGTFDADKGILSSFPVPEFVCNGADLIAKE